MQGNRRGRDPFFDFSDPFASFGGFGGRRSLLPGFFGGRDPFDDPFFTRPFGGMFGSSFFGPTGSPFVDGHASGFLEHQPSQPNRSRGPIIEELNSDEEKEEDIPSKRGRLSKEPFVEHPDDEAEERESKQMQHRNDFNMFNNTYTQPQPQPQPQPHSFTFQSSTVTYGGANGAYYTSSRTRRSGSDGLTIDESKEADSATAQATHRIARGIHDKGHSVTRKLNPDGRVNTMQTLHNLNEDELTGFEEMWKGKARKHLPGWSEGFTALDGSGSSVQNGMASRGVRALPSTERAQHTARIKPDTGDTAGPSNPQNFGRVKAAVGNKTTSSRGKPRARYQ